MPRPRARYRRQVVKRSRKEPRGSRHRRDHGQRRQLGSGSSRDERRMGSALRARRRPNQGRGVRRRALTHNLMLLAAA